MSKNEINFYIDSLIAEAVFGEDLSYKKASILSDLTSSVSQYVSNHIDPDDKVGSVLNLLAPGAISVLFGGKIGLFFGLLMRVFNVDVAGILREIYNSIKSHLTQNSQIGSDEVNGYVNAAIRQNVGDVTPVKSTALLKYAPIAKIALQDYEDNLLYSTAKPINFTKSFGVGLLGRILSFVFMTALSSAGLMVAGDAINKLIGRPNAFDNTLQQGKSVEAPQETVSKQTKFPVKAGYNDVQHDSSSNWIEKYSNDPTGIQNMLINFAKEVYDGLDGLESEMLASPLFKATVDNIAWYNHTSAGDQIVFIPKFFKSKKDIVDHFIDDVANRAGSQAPAPTPSTPSPNTSPNQMGPIPKIPGGSFA
jgi:hypothetical protein